MMKKKHTSCFSEVEKISLANKKLFYFGWMEGGMDG